MSATDKRIVASIIAAVMLPLVAFASPTSVDRLTNHIEPLIKTDYVKGAYFIASSTSQASTFPYASTTALSGTSLCIGSDCRTVWPSGGGGTTVGTVSTSSIPTVGQLAYWTSSAYPSLLGTVATGTLAATSPISLDNARYLIGGNATISIANADADGSTKGAASFTANDFDASSGNISLDYTNGQKASGSVPGFLSSADWTTFNGKQAALTFSAPLFNSANTISWYGLATTSSLSSSNILVSNGTNGVYGVATSTLSASSPLTGSFVQIGSGGSLGCQTASGSQAGCLSSADWTTFNNKQTTISTSFPLSISAGTLSWIGLATSTALTSGQVVYASGVKTLASVATTTLSVSGPLSITAARGTLVGGSNATISWSGLATTSAISSGQVLYGTSVSGVSSVATSTIAVGSSLSVASGAFGYQVGGSNVTFGLNLGNANTWTALQSFTAASTTHLTAATSLQIPNGSSIASTIAGYLGLDTTDNQLKIGTGSSQAVLDQRRFLTFGYSTSTWSGTTTIPLGFAPAALTLNTIQCSTDAGTVEARFYYGPTPTSQYVQASTTAGVTTWSSSNTPGAAAYLKADFGNPASSPTQVSCTISGSVTGT